MKPYYKDAAVTLYYADCREVLSEIADMTFDLSANDPPYGVQAAEWDGAVPYDVLPMIRRVTRGMVLWFGAAPTMKRDLVAFESPPDRTMIWAPKFTLSHTRANGVYFRWHPIYCWNLPLKHCGPKWDIVDVSTNTGRRWWKHPGTKPEKLMQQLLGFAVSKPGQPAHILDAFSGSGSTLVAAKSLGFTAVGVDYDEDSCEIAAKRLSNATVLPPEIAWASTTSMPT